MNNDLGPALTRELQEVADRVRIPPLPPLPTAESAPAPRRVGRLWQPLLAAAAVVLVIGATALLISQRGDDEPQPAPAPTVSTQLPDVPYVFDGRLYVAGTQVPGSWLSVESRDTVWLAKRADGTWWFGAPGDDGGQIDAQIEQPPALSPNGLYVAFIDLSTGQPLVTGFDTRPSGEGLGSPPIDLPATEDGIPLRVRAVTDDGQVIVQGTRTSLMWPAASTGDRTVVDLTETAPDQVVLQGTAAGLVVVDGADGAVDATSTAPYLADLSADGRFTSRGSLPTYDDLAVSPSGTWLLWSPPGTLGGEVTAVATLQARPVDGDDETTLTAPEGWGFGSGTWTWEDDRTFIATLLPLTGSDPSDAQLVRCSVSLGACRSFPGPEAETPGSSPDSEPADGTAAGALDAAVRAAAADDRGQLLDPAVIAADEWELLVRFADGQGGSVSGCRDNGGGSKDCEIALDADSSLVYYAILEPAQNAYGWRIVYVSMADG